VLLLVLGAFNADAKLKAIKPEETRLSYNLKDIGAASISFTVKDGRSDFLLEYEDRRVVFDESLCALIHEKFKPNFITLRTNPSKPDGKGLSIVFANCLFHGPRRVINIKLFVELSDGEISAVYFREIGHDDDLPHRKDYTLIDGQWTLVETDA
jgi:hypothetical protein